MLSLGLLFELECDNVRIILILQFVVDKKVEDEAIVGDEGKLRVDSDEVEDDEKGLNNQA